MYSFLHKQLPLAVSILLIACLLLSGCGEKVAFSPDDKYHMTTVANEKGDVLTYTVTSADAVQVTVFTFKNNRLNKAKMTHYEKSKKAADFVKLSLTQANQYGQNYKSIRQSGKKVTAYYDVDMMTPISGYTIAELKTYMEAQLYSTKE